MSNDIRISTGFCDHPKIKLLIRKCGFEGPFCLLKLWTWSAENRTKGSFTESSDFIEIASGWSGEPSAFFDACIELKLIESTTEGYYLHDWRENQPWVYGSNERSDSARYSRLARTRPEIFQNLKENGINAVSTNLYDKLTSGQRFVNGSLTPAPAPAPAPAPSPAPSPNTNKENIKKKKSQIDPEMELDERMILYAVKRGMIEKCVADCFEDFKLHHAANGSKMMDWKCAWQKWVRNAEEFTPKYYGKDGKTYVSSKQQAFLDNF